MKEEFRDIEGFEGMYRVSNLGKVISNKRGEWREIRPSKDAIGYLHVRLYKEGLGRYPNGHIKAKLYKVHRLVLSTFYPNQTGMHLDVNHKDGVKTNNKLSNLEWCTRSQNVQHAIDMGLNNVSDVLSVATKITFPNGQSTKFKSRVKAAEFLNCSDKALYYWMDKGQIPKGKLKDHKIENV
jgi:hypothetical protein